VPGHLFRLLNSRTDYPVGKPVAAIGRRKRLLARLADRLGGWSNVVPDDFINRLAGRARIKRHCDRHGHPLSLQLKEH